ncbi:MAG TPA: hypothetical protein VMT68_06030 [Caulobacteraceae bacterium]|nr:hypothetical protein [Caulobacteraceae bacterium]
MAGWTRVKWTEAGQVTELLDWPTDSEETAKTPPEAYFRNLRSASRLEAAVFFLGMALPRQETVAWAARAVRDLVEGMERPRPDTDALRAALLWVQDPSEGRRRAAFDAAQNAEMTSPERLAAMAVFLSGGSMAPENVQPVPAPPDVAGRIGAGAILVAASRRPDRVAAINRALDAGDEIAQWGLNGRPA